MGLSGVGFAIYLAALLAPSDGSGLPRLIHSMVDEIGCGPTCKYTPSSGGSKYGNDETDFRLLLGSFVNPCLGTGAFPIPKPALVSASARASAALDQANHGWFGCSAVHGFPVGNMTYKPSGIAYSLIREMPVPICCTFHPCFVKTIAISLARFCASLSPTFTWYSSCVPANFSIPANQDSAGGRWLIPNNPTCLGSITVCRARLSACNLAVSLFNRAARICASAAVCLARSDSAIALAVSNSFALSRRLSCRLISPSLQNAKSVLASTSAAPIISPKYASLYASSAVSGETSGNKRRIPLWWLLSGVFVVVLFAGLAIATVVAAIKRDRR